MKRDKLLAEYEPALRQALTGYYEARFTLGAVRTPVNFLQNWRENLITPADFRRITAGDVVSPLERAVDQLIEVADTVPERPDAHYYLAQAYVLLERPAEARSALKRVLKTDPDFVPANVLQWELEAKSSQEIEAELTNLVSQYVQPDLWQHWWLLARQSAKKTRWSEAVHAYTELIGLASDESGNWDDRFVGLEFEAYMQRGIARLEARETENAHQDFIAARVLAPSLAPELLLAKAYHVEFGSEKAEQTFEDVYTENPERQKEIALWVVAVKNALSSYDEDHLGWIDRLGDHPITDLLQANCLSRLGRTEDARDAAGRAINRDSEDPRAYVILGRWHLEDFRSGQGPPGEEVLEELIEVSSRAVQLDPTNPVAIRLHRTAQNYRQRSDDRKLDTTVLTMFTLVLGQVALAQGSFQNPRSLGPAVNSFAFETTPVVSANGLEILRLANVDLSDGREALLLLAAERRIGPFCR